MDLIDLMEKPSERGAPRAPLGWRYIEKWPTLAYDPHKNAKVRAALDNRDWRALRSIGVSWWDEHSNQWFPFTKNFFDHIEYALVSDDGYT